MLVSFNKVNPDQFDVESMRDEMIELFGEEEINERIPDDKLEEANRKVGDLLRKRLDEAEVEKIIVNSSFIIDINVARKDGVAFPNASVIRIVVDDLTSELLVTETVESIISRLEIP